MKSRINLLTESNRPRLELISLNLLVFLAGLSLLVVIGTYLIVANRAAGVSKTLQATKAEQSRRQQQLTRLSEQLAQQQESPVLIAEHRILDTEIQQKRQLLAQLSGREAQKSRGFSTLMLDLAAQHNDDLWLTKINLNAGFISFEGQALDASAVPRWVNSLGQSSYFVATEFASAKVYRDEQEAINFSLSSSLGGSEEETDEQ